MFLLLSRLALVQAFLVLALSPVAEADEPRSIFRIDGVDYFDSDLGLSATPSVEARRQAAASLAWRRLIDTYLEEHGLEPVAEDIAAFLRAFDELRPRQDAAASQEDQTSEERRRLQEARREMAAEQVKRWRFHRAIYERWGGRVVFQQAGLEPVDAYGDFLDLQLASRELEILDQELDGLFRPMRDYIAGHHLDLGQEEDAAPLFDVPWWLQPRPRASPSAGGSEAARTLDPEDLTGLMRALGESSDANVRFQAARALGQFGETGQIATPILIRIARGDPDADVRGQAVQALGLIKPPITDVLPTLVFVLEHDQPVAAFQSAYALGAYGPAASPALRPLVEALGHGDAEVRESAAYALGELGSVAADALTELERAVEDPDPRVRSRVEWALQTIRSQSTRKAFRLH